MSNQDYTVRQLLELEACTNCRYCAEVCPAVNASQEGKLSALYRMKGLKQILKGRTSLLHKLLGKKELSPEEWKAYSEPVYRCTLCGNCQEVCPVGIHLKDLWLTVRHDLFYSKFHADKVEKIRDNLEESHNVFAEDNEERADWVEDVSHAPDHGFLKEKAEVVYFTGCVAAYFPLAQKIPLDFALTHVRYNALAMGIELLIAGLFGQIFSAALPHIWGGQGALKPDPIERRLQTRFLVNLAPLVLFLVIALMIADWIVAGRVAKSLLNERMAGTAELAAHSLPFFQESGQNLILELSRDPRWYTSSPAEVRALLELSLRTIPFFRQLYYLDQDGDPVAGSPYNNFNAASPLPAIEEHSGIQLALNGVPNQSYTIPPPEGESAAYVSLLGTVFDEQEQVRGVLVGRTDLASNPFTLPIQPQTKTRTRL